jgi:predicted  nucleic acid-binding Zn-ribbon protein
VASVTSATSVNALQASVAQAERQVQQDQSRVNADRSRLQASRDQLTTDQQKLSTTQQQSDQAQQQSVKATPAVNLDQAIQNPPRSEQVLPAELTPAKPSVNSLGQTIGKFINVTA